MLITTPRLLLRPLNASDLDPIAALNADAEVMRFFPKQMTREESAAALQRYRDKTEKHGYSFAAAELRATGEVIGLIGLGYLEMDADFCPCVEVGWRLDRKFWGKGYAPEGARAWLDYAFNELGAEKVVAQTAIQNTPSIRVMEKLGMQPERCFMHPLLEDCPRLQRSILYAIERTTYVTRKTPRITT